MAIRDDNSNVSIEFLWEMPDNPENKIWVRFHNTSMGETFSISDDQENWYEFPATLFSESTDFLRNSYGLLRPKKDKTGQKIQGPRTRSNRFGSDKTALDLPQIEDVPEQEESEEPPLPMELANAQPVQSLSALAAGDVPKIGSIPVAKPQPEAGLPHESQLIPSTKTAGSQPHVVMGGQGDAAADMASGFGRAVTRTNPAQVAQMTDDDLLQASKRTGSFNESRGIRSAHQY